MSSIHYKFRSSLEYDTLTFDGPSISLSDLRDAIVQQKKIGKSSDFTLEVTNAQTKEVYHDSTMQIPRNTSVVVKRVPVARLAAVTGKIINPEAKEDQDSAKVSLEKLSQTGDLANANASEVDKITAMMHQSGEQFQPDQYVGKVRPGGYICFRCGQPGHFIRNCPTIGDSRFNNTQRFGRGAATEYYIMQMKERERLATLKAPVTSNRSYSPVVSSDAHSAKVVPVELQCPMCKKLLHDAVLISCCGTSYCDECIRNYLIDNDFACPSCKEKTSPDNLIANKSLRQAVENFKKTEHLASSSASTSQPGTTVNNTTAIVKTENAAPLVETKPKISITLLKKKEPTPIEQKATEGKGETNASDDILNSSAGPTTEAQLFEDIAKETQSKVEAEDAAREKAAEDAALASAQFAETAAMVPIATSETTIIPGSLPQTQLPMPGQIVMSNAVVSATLTQPVMHSAAALQLQQQSQIVAQQIQLQQQQIYLQHLRQQQQQLGFQQARLQQADASQLQPGLVVQAQPQIVQQQVRPPLASMPMTSSINPALNAQQVIVSGPQVGDPALQVGAAPVVQQRLMTGGIVAPLNHVANVAPVVVRRVQPNVGLSMSTAFVPDSVHSVVPSRLPSRMIRAGAGRDTGSFSLIDPLFDLAAKDSTGFPMSEEEFYRAKIKMKDFSGKPQSRSRSRSKERPRIERYPTKDSRSRRRDRSRSYERKDTHARHDSRDRVKESDRHSSHDRHSSRDRHDSRDRHSSKERHNSRKKTDKSSRREKHQDSKRSPRPEELLQRKRKEKLNELVKGYDSFDEEERELVDHHKNKKRRLHASPSRSRPRKPSPINSLRIDPKRAVSRKTSTGSWSRSPTPVVRETPPVKKRETTNFSGDEFETVKLEDSDGKTKKHRSRSSKKARDDCKPGSKTERESRKRKSDEGGIGRELKIKKSRKGDVLPIDRKDKVATTETDFRDEKQKQEEVKKRDSRKESKEKSKAKKASKEKGKKLKEKSSTEISTQESTELTDDSEGWDEILNKKNKKIIAKELEKKARKEKKAKAKRDKKAKEKAKAAVVEIKTTKPLVDFSSSQTESEFEVKVEEPVIEGQEGTIVEENLPIWSKPTVAESGEGPEVQQSPEQTEKSGETEVEMTNNHISETATLSEVPVEENEVQGVGNTNKEGVITSMDGQQQIDQGEAGLVRDDEEKRDESMSIAVKTDTVVVTSESNVEVLSLPSTSEATIDTQVSSQAAVISDQKQTEAVKATEEPSSTKKDQQGGSNKGEISESEQLASLFASIDEVLNEPKAGTPTDENPVVTVSVTAAGESVEKYPKRSSESGVELAATEEQNKVGPIMSKEESDDVVMPSEKEQGDVENLTEVEIRDFVVTRVVEEAMNFVDAKVNVTESGDMENKDLDTGDIPLSTKIVPTVEKDSDEGTLTVVTENEAENVTQNEAESAVDIPSEKQNIIDSNEKMEVQETGQETGHETGAVTEQASVLETESIDATEQSKEMGLGWREEKGYNSESSANAEAAEPEGNSGEEVEGVEEEGSDVQDSEDEEADSSGDDDVSVEEGAAEEEIEAAGSASAEGEDSVEEGTDEEESGEVDGSDSEEAASDAEDATDDSEEEGQEASEGEQESEVEEHVATEKNLAAAKAGSKAVAVRVVNGTDHATDKSDLESDSDSERKRAKKKKKRKEKRRREKERRRQKKKRKHSDDLSDDDDEDADSDDEKEKQRRKRKRAEKKAKKQKRKHKKHKHNKKHRKSKKHDDDDSDDEFLDDGEIESETEHKKKHKKSKMADLELDNDVSLKHSKVSRSKKPSSKSRNVENDTDNNRRILVVNTDDLRSQHSLKHESRTVHVEKDLRDDIRRIEPRKKIKISRTVRT